MNTKLDWYGIKRFMSAPREAPDPPEPVVCTRSELCKGCPYPGHGFICWGQDERCMRTEVERLNL